MLSGLLSIGQLLPIALIVVIVVCVFESCWRKCPPDKLMIVSGAGKMRSVSGKGTFVIPGFQRVDMLALGAVQVQLTTENDIPTQDAILIHACAVANFQIGQTVARFIAHIQPPRLLALLIACHTVFDCRTVRGKLGFLAFRIANLIETLHAVHTVDILHLEFGVEGDAVGEFVPLDALFRVRKIRGDPLHIGRRERLFHMAVPALVDRIRDILDGNEPDGEFPIGIDTGKRKIICVSASELDSTMNGENLIYFVNGLRREFIVEVLDNVICVRCRAVGKGHAQYEFGGDFAVMVVLDSQLGIELIGIVFNDFGIIIDIGIDIFRGERMF